MPPTLPFLPIPYTQLRIANTIIRLADETKLTYEQLQFHLYFVHVTSLLALKRALTPERLGVLSDKPYFHSVRLFFQTDQPFVYQKEDPQKGWVEEVDSHDESVLSLLQTVTVTLRRHGVYTLQRLITDRDSPFTRCREANDFSNERLTRELQRVIYRIGPEPSDVDKGVSVHLRSLFALHELVGDTEQTIDRIDAYRNYRHFVTNAPVTHQKARESHTGALMREVGNVSVLLLLSVEQWVLDLQNRLTDIEREHEGRLRWIRLFQQRIQSVTCQTLPTFPLHLLLSKTASRDLVKTSAALLTHRKRLFINSLAPVMYWSSMMLASEDAISSLVKTLLSEQEHNPLSSLPTPSITSFLDGERSPPIHVEEFRLLSQWVLNTGVNAIQPSILAVKETLQRALLISTELSEQSITERLNYEPLVGLICLLKNTRSTVRAIQQYLRVPHSLVLCSQLVLDALPPPSDRL